MYGNAPSQDTSKPDAEKIHWAEQWQAFFLERLRHLVSLRLDRGQLASCSDTDLRLVDKAIYCTFCECLDLGVGGEARALLRREDKDVRSDDLDENRAN